MWRNVAGEAAGSESQGRDVVIEALEERRERFSNARDMLCDPSRTAFLFVTVAERLPVLETHRIMTALSRHGIPVGGVIVNQLLPGTTTDPFLVRRKAREEAHLADIAIRFEDWPVGYLPLLDRDPVGADQLERLFGLLRAHGTEAPA
jgi:arsenite-transporting ATPase